MFLNSKAIFVNESKKKLKRFESWLGKVTKGEKKNKVKRSRDSKKNAERKRKSEGR